MTGGPTFRDHFACAAPDYARFRPRYPAGLFAWLAAAAPTMHRAWDCGTGSGQAAVALAAHAGLVIASDASASQLAHAERHARVRYLACTAERSALASRSVGLVTVAQALHWFDAPAFFEEARRVLVPGGVIAAWTYGDFTLGAPLDDAARPFMTRVRPYWPHEREQVEQGYRGIDFPVRELEPPPFSLAQEWTLPELLGYVGTWSAVLRYREARGDDPVALLWRDLGAAWGPPETRRIVRWPLRVRAGHT